MTKIFDCDNHYYEAPDAFTRHVPVAMQPRCVQWTEIDGRKRHVIAGKLDFSVGNPLFHPIAKPGVLYDYFKGNPQRRQAFEMMRGDLEPQPAAYRSPEARLARMDEQGVEAIWLFPTLGVLYEEKLTHDTEALCTLFSAFNRWLEEDWGLSRGRIFAAPYISLADVKWACSELEWALERDARIGVMRPAAARTADGPRAPGSTCFDPFWARAAEAGITVVIHTGNSGFSTNGYDEGGFGLASVGMDHCPSVAGLVLERAANDFLLDLAYKKVFERFPNLRIASIENGSAFLPNLLRQLVHASNRNPWHFREDPVALFREHVWINPFWEDDLREVIELMGPERVIFGSDWPHIEGMPQPLDYLSDLVKFDAATQKKILRENTVALTRPRPA